MIYAALSTLCILVFSQTLRYSQVRGARDYVAGAVNYCLAAVLAGVALAAVAGRPGVALWPTALLGVANGASFFGQFLLILAAYRLAGVGITTAVGCAGIVVPVLVSWRLWGEPMTPWRWVALGVVPVSMLLMRRKNELHPHLSWKADLVLAAIFLNSGLSYTLHKAANIYLPAARAEMILFLRPHQIVYEAFLFATAAALSSAYAVARRGRLGKADLALGSVMGLANVLAVMLSVVGLGVVAAGVFLPTVTCASVSLSAAVSWVLWREKLTPRQIVGLAAAAGVVVLVNL